MSTRWHAIRRAAEKLRTNYWDEHAGDDPAAALDMLSDIAEKCLHLSVLEDAFLPSNVVGMLDLDIGLIRVRAELPPTRRAFVIAHEIGHAALGHPARYLLQDEDEQIDESPDLSLLDVKAGVDRSYSDRDRWELEANGFAAEMLVSLTDISEAMRLDATWSVDSLADVFGVSRAAMLSRLVTALNLELEQAPPAAPPSGPVQLDADQSAAAFAAAPALVLAGPGAGKTRMLVERFAHLVNEGCDPRRILALTFSNKAAEEMRERIAAAMPEHAHALRVTTYHALGLELLTAYGQYIGRPGPLKLLTPTDAYVLMRSRIGNLDLGPYEDLHFPSRHLKDLLSAVSQAKDEMVGAAQFSDLADKWVADLQALPLRDGETQESRDAEFAAASDSIRVASFYAAYEAALHELGLLDYGDLINETLRLFSLPAVARDIRADIDQILVDEIQDINTASGKLIFELDGGRGLVWAVGDPRQSIYRFRGASPANLDNFMTDYPRAQLYKLPTNYRSLEGIVQAGLSVRIADGSRHADFALPHLRAHRGSGGSMPTVEVAVAPKQADELRYVAQCISATICSGRRPEQIAVLCRTREQARLVSEHLNARDIANTWGGNLHERSIFKDIVAVLLLVSNDPRGLVRLARLPEHLICEADLRRILDRSRTVSVRQALREVDRRLVDGFMPGTVQSVNLLRRICAQLRRTKKPWQVVASYLFEHAAWGRALFDDATASATRKKATVTQVVNLARQFEQSAFASGQEKVADFIKYLATCLEAGALGSGDNAPISGGAVHVLTAHGSKGLQWPVVIVPNLAEGRFPSSDRNAAIQLPPGILSAPSEHDKEEACLFYVAVTRAEDRLILTRAEQYPQRQPAASPHLQPLLGSLSVDGHVREVAVPADSVTAEAAVATSGGVRLDEPIPFSKLNTYAECPRRFLYTNVYGLSGGDSAYPRFHRALYAAMDELCSASGAGSQVSDELVDTLLGNAWGEFGPVGHGHEDLYRRRAKAALYRFAKQLEPGNKVAVRQQIAVEIDGHDVLLTIDEQNEATGVWRRHKTGKPPRDTTRHTETNEMVLLQIAAEQSAGSAGGAHVSKVSVYYSATGEEAVANATPKVKDNRRKKVAGHIASMEKGEFQAKPGDHCLTCPANLVCPS